MTVGDVDQRRAHCRLAVQVLEVEQLPAKEGTVRACNTHTQVSIHCNSSWKRASSANSRQAALEQMDIRELHGGEGVNGE